MDGLNESLDTRREVESGLVPLESDRTYVSEGLPTRTKVRGAVCQTRGVSSVSLVG